MVVPLTLVTAILLLFRFILSETDKTAARERLSENAMRTKLSKPIESLAGINQL